MQQELKKIEESHEEAVYVKSVAVDEKMVKVSGYDFNKGLDYNEVFKTYIHTGF